MFEAPGPFWIKADGKRIRVVLPDGRVTLQQSFDAYDIDFHVYWDKTHQAMTCEGTNASYCWPFIFSIPPWRAPAPALAVQPTSDACQLLLVEMSKRLPHDVIEHCIFPSFTKRELISLSGLLKSLYKHLEHDTLERDQARTAWMKVQHHLARPLKINLAPCYDDDDIRGHKRKLSPSSRALYSSHVWIMVPVVTVDAWMHNPLLTGHATRRHSRSPETTGVHIIGVDGKDLERCCIYGGTQSFVVQSHQDAILTKEPIVGESYGPQVVRFHMWCVDEDTYLEMPGSGTSWTLRFNFCKGMPILSWQIHANELSRVRCPWYSAKDNNNQRALTNANSNLDGITAPWVFAEYCTKETSPPPAKKPTPQPSPSQLLHL